MRIVLTVLARQSEQGFAAPRRQTSSNGTECRGRRAERSRVRLPVLDPRMGGWIRMKFIELL
jgi:hypothetical protein